jgi:hypothetical protein
MRELGIEFWLEELISECSPLGIASAAELTAALSVRISTIDHQRSSETLKLIAELTESIANDE